MTSRSLTLSAYRAIVRRAHRTKQDFSVARPPGELVWCHLGSTVDAPAVIDLADRIVHQRPGSTVLLTLPPDVANHWEGMAPPADVILRPSPDEHPRSIAAFLDHWRPDLGLWVWGNLRPNLIDEAARRKIPLHLVSADSAGFDGRRDRWVPELARDLVRSFASATARNATSAQRLSRLGMPRGKVAVQPRLRASGRLLPCDTSDLDDMSAQLSGRPVWLAAQVQPREVAAVLLAHQAALRSSLRLLLVLEPANREMLPDIQAELNRMDLVHRVWGDGEWPDEPTRVLIADIPDELGLWYRIATVSFLGGSLVPGTGGTDPMPAAALGTAILYGPHIRHYLPHYTRLANAGAARIVNNTASLSTAVSYLIAPDNAATMAHAGWDVSSESAEVIDRVVTLVQDTLDEMEPKT